MVLCNRIVVVGYNLVFVPKVDCNSVEVGAVRIRVVVVDNNLVAIVVERILFEVADFRFEGVHNHSLKMADFDNREHLSHNLDCLVYLSLVDLMPYYLAHSTNWILLDWVLVRGCSVVGFCILLYSKAKDEHIQSFLDRKQFPENIEI